MQRSMSMGVVMYGADDAGRRRGNNGKPGRRTGQERIAALVLTLGALAGCAGEGSSPPGSTLTASVHTDNLRTRPCAVVTRDMVSTTFAVAAADIEQSSMSSLCAYRWEGGDERLDVTVHVTAMADDVAHARLLFDQATAASTGPAPGARAAADFQEIHGLGDQARIDTGNGDVHVRHDRLYFTLNAYYGPTMPEVTPVPVPVPVPTSAMDARAEWLRNTIPQRRQAAMRLVRASVEAAEER